LTRTTLGWALVAALLAAGCGAPSTTPAAVPAAPSDTALPLDEYSAGPADVAQLNRGYRALVRRCMAAAGYSYPPAEPPGEPPGAGPSQDRNARRYGLTSAADAAARGYRPAAEPRPRLPELPPAGLAALTADGGCADRANRALAAHDPPGADPHLADELAQRSWLDAKADPRVAAVVARWSECMRSAGYRYAGPLDPPAAFRSGPVTALETGTARADVECKRRTGLVPAWTAVEAGYQRPLLDRHRAGLELARTALRGQLAAARAALTG
jgi:hypothetical protein